MAKVSFTTKDGRKISFTTKSKKSKIKKSSTKKRSSKSTKRATRSTRSLMPKKKKSGGKRRPGKKSFIDRIPILRNPTVQKIGFGLGMGVLVIKGIELAARFAPPSISGPLTQNAGIIKIATELVTEPLSAVVDVVTNPQMLSQITGRFTGANGATPDGNVVGFA